MRTLLSDCFYATNCVNHSPSFVFYSYDCGFFCLIFCLHRLPSIVYRLLLESTNMTLSEASFYTLYTIYSGLRLSQRPHQYPVCSYFTMKLRFKMSKISQRNITKLNVAHNSPQISHNWKKTEPHATVSRFKAPVSSMISLWTGSQSCSFYAFVSQPNLNLDQFVFPNRADLNRGIQITELQH